MVGILIPYSNEMLYENDNCSNISWQFLCPEENTNCIYLKDPFKASMGKIQRVSGMMKQIGNIFFHFSLAGKTDEILMV